MTTPAHTFSPVLAVAGNELLVGGVPLAELAVRAGHTPFYAYDRALITQRIADLRAQLPSGLRLHYAIKANPMPALVQHMATQVDGFDTASAGELQLALTTPIATANIAIAGPGKSALDLDTALAAGVLINVESRHELDRIAARAQQRGTRARVAVRVNPAFELKTSGMKMGGGSSPFGVDAEAVPALLQAMRGVDVDFDFVGFHIYCGSQNLRAAAIIEAQRNTFELAFQLAQHAPAPVRVLNIGGGFGIPYFPGDARLDVAAISTQLQQRMQEARVHLPGAEIVMELGRYLVGEAGVYVCRVVDRKVSRGKIFLITDGGLHHHLAASGNFGQVIRKNFPLCVAHKMGDHTTETVTVVGPLCTPLDILGHQIELPRAEIGDLIAVLQSGAYGLTASPTQFLSHPPPGEILV